MNNVVQLGVELPPIGNAYQGGGCIGNRGGRLWAGIGRGARLWAKIGRRSRFWNIRPAALGIYWRLRGLDVVCAARRLWGALYIPPCQQGVDSDPPYG